MGRQSVTQRETRTCNVCGREFTPKMKTNVYCSYECAREANRRNARKKVRRNRVDTFDSGMDPDESALRAVLSLDEFTRMRLRMMFAPRIHDAVRIWMESK